MEKKTKLIIVMVVISMVVVMMGITYAYFTASTSGGESVSTINTKAGKMTIAFSNSSGNIVLNDIYPKDDAWVTKNFVLTGNNNTDLDMLYKLSLVVNNNSFSNNALSYELTAINTSNNGSVVTSNGYINSSNITFGTGYFKKGSNLKHTYTLKVYFKKTPSNQNSDQEKRFAGYVKIESVSENEYSMIDGANQVLTGGTFTLRSSASVDKFQGVTVDGNAVDPSFYTVSSGSTIVKFTKVYDFLTAGSHEIRINSTDGYAETTINVPNEKIIFSFNGTEYTAYNGMDWADWILSYGISAGDNGIAWIGYEGLGGSCPSWCHGVIFIDIGNGLGVNNLRYNGADVMYTDVIQPVDYSVRGPV